MKHPLLYKGTYTISCAGRPTAQNISIKILEIDERRFSGHIKSRGKLKIDGEVEGQIDDKGIAFKATTKNGKIHTDWKGELVDSVFTGRFTAANTSKLARLLRRADLSGDWQCDFVPHPLLMRFKSGFKTFSYAAAACLALIVIVAILPDDSAEYPSEPPPAQHTQSTQTDRHVSTPQRNPFSYIEGYEQPSSPNASYAPEPGGTQYQPLLNQEQAHNLHGTVRDFTANHLRNQATVQVQGYERSSGYVQPHSRQPPGGYSSTDQMKAEGLGLLAVVAVEAANVGFQKYDNWQSSRAAEREAKRREQEREELRVLMEQLEAERKSKRWWR